MFPSVPPKSGAANPTPISKADLQPPERANSPVFGCEGDAHAGATMVYSWDSVHIVAMSTVGLLMCEFMMWVFTYRHSRFRDLVQTIKR